jgi:methyl-accepting chemotaxis protein
VESARAGEAGAGFAVVADEVRNLAIRSAEAAKSTNDLISKTIDGITAGDEFLKKTESGFQAVGDELRQIGRKVTNVADASKKQAVDIERIKEAMTQIGKFTSDNSAASEYCASAASALHDQTKELKGGIGILSGLVGQTVEASDSGRTKVRQIAR